MKRLALLLALLPALGLSLAHAQSSAPTTGPEILWDAWDVPHIYAQDDTGLAYAFGWAQAQAHGDLILRLYAQARGEAAALFGEAMLDSDRFVHTVGIPRRAEAWYEAQDPNFRALLDSFAAGINAYADANPQAIDDVAAGVLPVTGVDVMAHVHRTVHFTFVAGEQTISLPTQLWRMRPGSNGWAIGPNRSATGNAILLGNPHLPWSDLYLFFEAHANTPDFEFYGATLVGFPVLALGFNEHLGWTHTVNTYDGADLYELTLEDGGYLLDGEIETFETDDITLRVRQEDGSFRSVPLTVRRSIHGPVITEEGDRGLALRVAGLDRPHLLAQWWDLSHATDLDTFTSILERLQLPMFNFIYADRAGNIMELYNGLVPQRSTGDHAYWLGTVPGDTTQTLWHDYLPFDALPRVVNPPTGWLQNTNESPWFMTYPFPLEASDFAPYLAPAEMPLEVLFRTQQSMSLLLADEDMTFEEAASSLFTARSKLADRLLDDLVPLAERAEDDLLREAATVLAEWEGAFEADSRGATLFFLWYVTYLQQAQQAALVGAPTAQEAIRAVLEAGNTIFAVPWSHQDPLGTPDGLADPERALAILRTAAEGLRQQAGSLDVPWGDVVTMSDGATSLPATSTDGLMGVFQVQSPAPQPDGAYRVVAGDSFAFLVEFSEPLRAAAILTYGNSSASSSHQLALYADDQLRPVLLERAAVEAQLKQRIVLP